MEANICKKKLKQFECGCGRIVTFDSNNPYSCCACGEHYVYSYIRESVRKINGEGEIKTISVEDDKKSIDNENPFPQLIPGCYDDDIEIYQIEPDIYIVARKNIEINLKSNDFKKNLFSTIKFKSDKVKNGVSINSVLIILKDRIENSIDDDKKKKRAILILENLKKLLSEV